MKYSKTMLTILFSMLTCLVGLCGAAQAQQKPPVSNKAIDISEAPSWGGDILSPGGRCDYCGLNDESRASILGLGSLSEASVVVASEGAGGTPEFRQYRTGRGTLTVREVDGYFSFGVEGKLPPLTPDTSSRIPKEEEARQMAKDISMRLGLPPQEVSGVECHGIAVSGGTVLGPVAPTTIGRMVEFKRAVNGRRVLASQARLEFGRDGVLNSATVRWPAFKLKPGLAKTRDRSSVLKEIASRTKESVVKRMEVVYVLGDDGWMTPAMLVNVESVGLDSKLPTIRRHELVPLAE